jgi:hypothetical protein
MGVSSSKIPEGSPLTWLLKHWGDLYTQSLKKKTLVFYCIEAWPKYSMTDNETWPKGSNLNYNTILQLDQFCRKEGKWVEVPYVQLFFYLRDHPQWAKRCKFDSQTLAMVCSNAYPDASSKMETSPEASPREKAEHPPHNGCPTNWDRNLSRPAKVGESTSPLPPLSPLSRKQIHLKKGVPWALSGNVSHDSDTRR